MRLVLTSDTHGHFPSLPPGDVLLHAGDLTQSGTEHQVKTSGEWLQSLDYKHILLVPGNHDFLFQRQEALSRKLLGKVQVMIDQELVMDGIKYYGSPWQPFFFNWAFNVKSFDARLAIWNKIPVDTQVLITHCPPFGILDKTPRQESVGDEALTEGLKRLSALKLHVFGHIHCAYGSRQVGPTLHVNASHCDEDYRGVNPAFVFDL